MNVNQVLLRRSFVLSIVPVSQVANPVSQEHLGAMLKNIEQL